MKDFQFDLIHVLSSCHYRGEAVFGVFLMFFTWLMFVMEEDLTLKCSCSVGILLSSTK